MSSRSPSKIRYDGTHPNVSFRVSEDVKEWIDSVRGDSSYTETIRNAMLSGAKVQEAVNSAYRQGYEDARKTYRLTFWCSVCRKPMYCQPNDEMHRALVKYAFESGWHHANGCKTQR
ncbi:MAG: hypothetical protein QXP70_01210 [Methanomassiliicoccales archaeon]